MDSLPITDPRCGKAGNSIAFLSVPFFIFLCLGKVFPFMSRTSVFPPIGGAGEPSFVFLASRANPFLSEEVRLYLRLVLCCVRQMIFSLLSHFGRWQSRDCFLFLLVLLTAPVLCVCDSLGSQVLFVWGAQSHCGMSLPPDMGEENSCAALCTAFIHRTMVSVEHETVLADTDLFCLLDTKKECTDTLLSSARASRITHALTRRMASTHVSMWCYPSRVCDAGPGTGSGTASAL